MTTIITSAVQPHSILRGVPLTGDFVSSMRPLKFYYRGVTDVLALQKNTSTCFTVYHPIGNVTPSGEVNTLVKSLIPDIEEDMKVLDVKINEWFLFDTHTKKIVTPSESFQPYLQMYNAKKALFVEEGGTIAYILNDMTDYGELQFVSLQLAKGSLIKPDDNAMWGQVGKFLLNFLAASQYYKKYGFTGLAGSWDSVLYKFKNDTEPPMHKIDQLIFTRSLEIASDIAYPAKDLKAGNTSSSSTVLEGVAKEVTPVDTDEMSARILATNTVYLSEIIQLGAKSFTYPTYDMLEVEIDLMQDQFKEIIFDVRSGIFLINLNRGCAMLPDELADALACDVDSIKLVESRYPNADLL